MRQRFSVPLLDPCAAGGRRRGVNPRKVCSFSWQEWGCVHMHIHHTQSKLRCCLKHASKHAPCLSACAPTPGSVAHSLHPRWVHTVSQIHPMCVYRYRERGEQCLECWRAAWLCSPQALRQGNSDIQWLLAVIPTVQPQPLWEALCTLSVMLSSSALLSGLRGTQQCCPLTLRLVKVE